MSQVVEAPAVKTLERRVAHLEADVDAIDADIAEWSTAVETHMLALQRVVEEKLDISLSSYMQVVEAEMDEENDAGQ